jgi:hypothetical protein
MADNNNEEKLKITAELDTSKLKQQAQQGMQSVVNEEKKVEAQSRQTSRAVDNIGQSGKNVGQALQQAGSQGTQAMKQIGQEADKTAQKIANIEKSVKNIKLNQGLGIASRLVNSEIGQGIGNAVGDALGMSDKDKTLAGEAAKGFLTGAAAGAAIGGPWGAVIGGLGNAAASLLKAGNELQNASKSEKEKADLAVFEGQKALDQQRAREQFANLLANGSDNQLLEQLDYERNQLRQSDAGIKALQDRANRGTDDHGFALTTEAKVNLAKNLNDALEHRLRTLQNIAALEAESARRDREADARVAKFLADEENAANAFVGPEIPENIRQQREADAVKEEQRRAKALDMNWKSQLKDSLRENQSLIRSRESFMQNMGSTKLTDSMVQMGAGGYGIQMQGINSYVRNMASSLEALYKVSDSILTTIKSIEDKYSPYNGEFI